MPDITHLPLAVRLKTSRADRHITRDVRDLSFKVTAPGGFASAQMSLNRPLAVQPDEIAYYGSCYIYDRRNGRVLFEGRLEDPGRGAGRDGEVWTINVIGPAGHTFDRQFPIVYVDTNMQTYQPMDVTDTPHGTVNITNDAAVAAGGSMAMQFPNNTVLHTNSRVVRAYEFLTVTGQLLGRFDYTWTAGRTNANLRVQAVTRDSGTGGAVSRDEQFNVAGGASSPKVITTDFANTRNWLELRILWNGGGVTVADDVTWAAFVGPIVQGTRYNKAGTHLTTGASYSANTVLASDVVADLLGRVLTRFDGANAQIATTSYGLGQLAYYDPVTANKILNDLMVFEPGYYWAAWESNAAGLHRFEWSQWPTSIRYQARIRNSIDSPGSADELYNEVVVRYRDTTGYLATTIRTSTVSALTAAGLTRTGYLDLGDDAGGLTNAQRAGDQFLAEHAYAPNAGTLVVSDPIYDLTYGRLVMPWEILPGTLIRVAGILPRIDALNATARDGVTNFRVRAMEFRSRDASAALTLDSYPFTVAQSLAALQRDRPSAGPVRRR